MTEPYIDPPDMPDDERMSAAEFKIVREGLGLSGEWIAANLSQPVNPRTVRNWEQGRSLIPDGVRLEIERWEKVTGEFISGVIEKLLDIPDPLVVTYRTDEEYHQAHPDIVFPASWHRRVIWRVALEVPALRMTYAPSHPESRSHQ